MTENTQNGFIYEILSVLKLAVIVGTGRINMQKILFFLAFLTFGLGDAITGAYMMDMYGVAIEANPITRFLFMTQGFEGFILTKIWFTCVILFAAYIIQLRSPAKMYWGINGFLVALMIGGLMALNANLSVIAGEIPPNPNAIIFIYMSLMLVLTEIGGFVDERKAAQMT